MIRLGKNVTQYGDQLYDVEVEKVFRAIQHPGEETRALIQRLQTIKVLDPGQYRKLKTQLPYVVCAKFHPKTRKKEHFLHTERFIVDIDHLSGHGIDGGQITSLLQNDPRVELLFQSPGGDGLKVLFKIEKPLADPAYYAAFYKAFCLDLDRKYQLGAALDHRTYDVSRCCFVSHDPDAYYNAQAEPIDPQEHSNMEDLLQLDGINREIKEREKQHREEKKEELGTVPQRQVLPDEVVGRIKEKMGMGVRKAPEKRHVQPEELADVMIEVEQLAESVGIDSVIHSPISYGRKVRFQSGKRYAEINIFTGKKGVSVVGTTKTGSDSELCGQLVQYLKHSL